MRKSALGFAAAGVAAVLLTAACSSSKSTGSGSTPSSAAGSGSSAAASTSSAASGKVQVGVILPDTTSSTRYTLYDKPLLQKAFDAAGIKSDIQNAGGSTSRFSSIAQDMINEGVKVMLIDSIDATSGAAVEQQAKTAGVQVIDYDRVNLGGSAGYYVSFDNEAVGKQQATTLVSCLSSVTNPSIIMMDGGTDVDNNAVLFAKGAHEVLDPLKASGKIKIQSESVVKGWDVNQAAPTFQQALTAAGGKTDGVLAANDDIANAVIGVLKQSGLAGKVQLTGQDSGVEGLQNILNGYQCMTIFKDVSKEADAAAKLAIALAQGKDAASAGVTLVNFPDPKLASHKIQALLLPAEVIKANNVEDVVTAGALTAAEICKGITAKCAAAGVK